MVSIYIKTKMYLVNEVTVKEKVHNVKEKFKVVVNHCENSILFLFYL